ncbi:hypothetical protein NEPAR06_1604 [Nematocida parisii]|uniref:Uncharacterized protein n=1 Tax=Nematocida parisii (strain ERTm3) TaxID=935791 RepID=I3EJA7_NEMP3|nr:uncharacterized protein NEPG_02541 [Nematocida parisii ERTm1]EIJ89304.1 hypothetical protein NEQG_00074 [Nematocida parisii ERTm3]KAI5142537.1 hypothetical protein NEPAR07_0142 [Nematocida parisii]EIJ92653.1 hypothetical protein NEPG_02541 [Nematocida parisii ERTm1]KAI5155176.1 hypothetical protein NEPAR06_1604 [Nematocida parisii]KAI5155881.1 hypothetical protein NEPAR05_0130 [Nematocida parisii]|eukprot:XP_013060368.1 hypothetical protein NEPG_02541 [Nematocida parisii ERTm1]
MNIYWVINLMIISNVWGRLKISEIESIQREVIHNETEGSLLINPKESLNPLFGRIIVNGGIMQKKRFLSPEIYTESKIEVDLIDCIENTLYINRRNYKMDRVQSNLYTKDELDTYSREYYTTLLRMFPSSNGSLSIKSDLSGSFYMFLTNLLKKEQQRIILSALLLLSEGIPLPMSTDRKGRGSEVVLTGFGESGDALRVGWGLLCSIQESKILPFLRFETILPGESIDVLSFFITNTEKAYKERQEISEQCEYKDLTTGRFFSSMRCLIQTYIYEFIESKEEMSLFIKTVHDMLYKYMKHYKSSNSSLPMRAKEIFHKYFISSSQEPTGMAYISAVKVVEGILNRNKMVPFENKNYAMTNTDVLRKEPTPSSILFGLYSTQKKPAEYTNYVETVLLNLFCCFLYDMEQQIYTTKHLPLASPQLKKFFDKYMYMFKEPTAEMHNDWSKVVENLQCKEIKYEKLNRTKMCSGLLNILYAILEIAGMYEQEQSNLSGLIHNINRENVRKLNNVISQDVTNQIYSYLKYLFGTISVNKNLTIGGDVLFLDIDDQKVDVYGCVEIVYKNYACTNYVPIIIQSTEYLQSRPSNSSPCMLLVNRITRNDPLMSHDINILMWKKEDIARMGGGAIQHMLTYYINIIMNSGRAIEESVIQKKVTKFIKRREDIKNDLGVCVNELLFDTMLCGSQYKADLAMYLLLQAVYLNLSNDHNIIRFVSNIVAESPIGNDDTQSNLFAFLYMIRMHNCLPNVNLTRTKAAYLNCFLPTMKSLIIYALDLKSTAFIYELVSGYVELSSFVWPECLDDLFYSMETKDQLNLLVSLTENNSTVRPLMNIIRYIEKPITTESYTEDDYLTAKNTVLLRIIELSCQDVSSFDYIIKECFRNITISPKISLVYPSTDDYNFSKCTAAIFSSIRSMLVVSGMDRIKFDRILSVYNGLAEALNASTNFSTDCHSSTTDYQQSSLARRVATLLEENRQNLSRLHAHNYMPSSNVLSTPYGYNRRRRL